MEVRYTKRFLKDLSKLPSKARGVIEKLVFEDLTQTESLQEVPQVKKLSMGNYYRIRVGVYRIGLEKHGNYIVLKRVLSRKDIYRYFP